MHLKRAF